MGWIDMHCDTLYELLRGPKEWNLSQNQLCIDINGMKKTGTMAQFFACFVDVRQWEEEWADNRWDAGYLRVLQMLNRLQEEENNDLRQILSYEELFDNWRHGKISAVATVEEGGVLNEEIERVEELYQNGVRLITLTWNYENCLAYPNSRNAQVMQERLKPFGMEVLYRMNELGMMVDVSHLSDGGFWDCIKYSKAPIVASHSNCRALCEHPRNLTDEMLKALAAKGGVAGLNFYPAFLRKEEEENRATVSPSDIARHAKHMIEVAGEEVVAIGTDFDGFEMKDNPDYLSGGGEIEKVWDAFQKEGITPRQIEKIQSENVLRVIKEVWK